MKTKLMAMLLALGAVFGAYGANVRVYVSAPSSVAWGDSWFCYAWDSGPLLGTWPGTQAVETETLDGVTWHYLDVSVNGDFGLIVGDGSGKQTGDFVVTGVSDGKAYFIEVAKSGGYYSCQIVRTATATDEPQTVWRFYSKAYKGHFFTISEEEKQTLIDTNPNWKFEGGAYRAYTNQAAGTTALYRFYSKGYKGHFFTIDEAEKDTIIASNPNWKYEGVAYYVYPEEAAGTVPVFRFWSKGYRHHFYTIDEAEKDTIIASNPNWKYEGVAFYALTLEEGAGAARGAAGKNEKGKAKRGRGEGGVVVTTSDGTDGSAVADGDEETGWEVDASGRAWVVLSFAEEREISGVEVVGENLPEGLRALWSADAEAWAEEGALAAARYVWVAFSAGSGTVRVGEISGVGK